MDVQVRDVLSDPLLSVMNFLNEFVLHYPDAISFAPGRPMSRFFNVRQSLSAIEVYVQALCDADGTSLADVFENLGQYSRTNGAISELIAQYLYNDEAINVSANDVIVTTGAQEAMALILVGLFEPGQDVLLASDPTYVGMTALAKLLNVEVEPVPVGADGVDPEILRDAIGRVRKQGKRPRALYDVPDFNNPLGTSMPLQSRHELLHLAASEDLLIIEDNPYGSFSYDAPPAPTLKSLDLYGIVLYIGTFSKTIFPGLRIGYVACGQMAGSVRLSDELSKAKSLLTVNTSSIGQALAGGILLEGGLSLRPLMSEKLVAYKQNRDRMAKCLATQFGEDQSNVRWIIPRGGFFVSITLPFDFDLDTCRDCVESWGVICMPMTCFSLRGQHRNQIRLSFSSVSPEEIDIGIERLAGYVQSRLAPS